MEAQDAPVSEETIHGLRDIRARRRRYWLASALGIPAFMVLGLIWYVLNFPSRWIGYVLSLALGIAWLSLSNHFERQVWAAKCPRCGDVFHANHWGPFQLRGMFLWSCQHCGLKLRADRNRRRDV